MEPLFLRNSYRKSKENMIELAYGPCRYIRKAGNQNPAPDGGK